MALTHFQVGGSADGDDACDAEDGGADESAERVGGAEVGVEDGDGSGDGDAEESSERVAARWLHACGGRVFSSSLVAHAEESAGGQGAGQGGGQGGRQSGSCGETHGK